MKHSEDTVAEPSITSDIVQRSSAVGMANWTRWIPVAALLIGVAALTLALIQWFDPASHRSASFSDQQVKDAKTSVCAAYTSVQRAVAINTHLEPSADRSPIAVATSARLALYGGGGYPRDRVASEPATPADLAKAVDYCCFHVFFYFG